MTTCPQPVAEPSPPRSARQAAAGLRFQLLPDARRCDHCHGIGLVEERVTWPRLRAGRLVYRLGVVGCSICGGTGDHFER